MIRVKDVEQSVFKFSGGELQVRVGDRNPAAYSPLQVTANLESSDDVVELALTVDALRRRHGHGAPIKLVCPYLPYARQDRVMVEGEALGLRVMCDLLNGMRLAEVEVWDAHSDVSLALLDNLVHVAQREFVRRVPVNTPDVVYVAPDAGAAKKVLASAKAYGRSMITAEKSRDALTGDITGTRVHSGHLGSRPVIMLDDICDGGRTFIELAKELRKVTDGPVYLYVTHGIFSNGLDVFEGLIDRVYTANPFSRVDVGHPLLTVISTEML